MWTAVVSLVFSVGIILGQHLLLQKSLPPMVAVGEELPPDPEKDSASMLDEEDSLPAELFSFYDALTRSEVPITDLEDEALALEDDASTEDTGSSESPFGIDEDAEPNTDDGSIPARFTIQVASHPTTERARTEMDRLQRLGLDPHLVAVDVPDHGKHYRVRIGKFATEDQARAYRNRLANEHSLQSFITPL